MKVANKPSNMNARFEGGTATIDLDYVTVDSGDNRSAGFVGFVCAFECVAAEGEAIFDGAGTAGCSAVSKQNASCDTGRFAC